ncbi:MULTISPECIES: transcription-repair coupling factor [unclassified Sphingopyxis]|uniref:transcription-repair coupling factor n=1 Tax=unclassified Sphingopyxis TaxID=2614943 RepID=UPI00073600D1|nr:MULTISPECIES: transcription-repair coupling factor [unclassified Sphingopyxis]KTE39306.1 transcription-repair coupling factor [Sphingopyxis sp. HIX]KTE83299.1 transcription-repair coupling factor [Sphingopyxis sp. HXXIV]
MTRSAADIFAAIASAPAPLTISRAADGFLPLLLADLARASDKRLVYVATDDAAMQAVADAAPFFAPDLTVHRFPAWDCLPYDRAGPSMRVSADRLATLSALQAAPKRGELILTTVAAVTQRTLTPFRVRQLATTLAPGQRIDRDALAELLVSNGFSRVDTVADQGEFAVRGGIVDLFPAGEETGLRVDFFGDEIESIRRFDPADQRSLGPARALQLLPAAETLLDQDTIKRFRSAYREIFGAQATGDPLYQAVSEGRRQAGMDHWLPLFEERLATIFDHIDPATPVLRGHRTEATAETRFAAIADYHANRVAAAQEQAGSYRPLKPETLYLTESEWSTAAASRPVHVVTPFDVPPAATVVDLETFAARDFTPERTADLNVYDKVADHLSDERRKGRRTIIASYSGGARERLSGLLRDHGVTSLAPADSWQEALGTASAESGGTTAMVVLPLDHGFASDAISLLTEQDILGERLVRRQKRRKSADAFLAELATLSVGDLVVHLDHGIGRYEGLTSIPVGNSPHDCVALTYAGGDKLYVPVENLDVLSRYGGESEGVGLDKLGGEAWQRRKARMKERIREIAGELLATAAARALRPGELLAADAAYPAFADRFPYQETDDQDRAIGDVLADMASGRPMDRLVCGDVGFGKTEVALRAAFVAAMAGVQVALVCPTTLLARQHFTNFVERFKGFPVNIGRLSRLVPAAEAQKTRDGLASGQIDIVVGTHAVIAKAVEFKNLGLVIVDEEQRFGVVHKERLKQLKTDVHVLTLTATPIPRTLQMAMSGLRELSVIQTPPVDRLAVRTYVAPWDPVVIREALLREHDRGGQSFFVTPRIKDLPDIEEFLRTRVPEIKYVVAHGQMAPGEVEERMGAFYDRKYDVLVSTTIVESGLDIPSANTLIVHRADRFGLAQLYQLRGRVGRSKTRAYAYLTTPDHGAITDTAEKRLKLLGDLDTLGAGFQLASHDLDIRGAGNLVGDEQSGHIREVGFELYQSMLEEAILVAKAEGMGAAPPREALSPVITIDAPILIPEDYVPDLPLRMALYRRLNDAQDRPALDAFAAEMIDRFGPLPPETANLIQLMEIKSNAKLAGIAKLDVGTKGALVSFHGDAFANVPGLIAYVERLKGRARIRPDNRLSVSGEWASTGARLNGALQLSKGLGKLAKQAG